jgi:hypothetical protein
VVSRLKIWRVLRPVTRSSSSKSTTTRWQKTSIAALTALPISSIPTGNQTSLLLRSPLLVRPPLGPLHGKRTGPNMRANDRGCLFLGSTLGYLSKSSLRKSRIRSTYHGPLLSSRSRTRRATVQLPKMPT